MPGVVGMRSRKFAVAMAIASLVAASCGSDPNEGAVTPPAASDDSGSVDVAGLTSQVVGDVTVHSFLGVSGVNGTYIVESENVLVIVDSQFRDGDPEAFRAAVDALGKPIDRLLITHDHIDHTGGLNTAFADAAVSTTSGVAARLDVEGRDIDIVSDSFTIDGIEYRAEEYEDAEASVQMVVTIDDGQGLFAGDLLYHDTHPFLTDDLENWIAILEQLESGAPTFVFPGHGEPGDIGLFAEHIEYLRTVIEILPTVTTADEFEESITTAYPDHRAGFIIDFYARSLVESRGAAS